MSVQQLGMCGHWFANCTALFLWTWSQWPFVLQNQRIIHDDIQWMRRKECDPQLGGSGSYFSVNVQLVAMIASIERIAADLRHNKTMGPAAQWRPARREANKSRPRGPHLSSAPSSWAVVSWNLDNVSRPAVASKFIKLKKKKLSSLAVLTLGEISVFGSFYRLLQLSRWSGIFKSRNVLRGAKAAFFFFCCLPLTEKVSSGPEKKGKVMCVTAVDIRGQDECWPNDFGLFESASFRMNTSVLAVPHSMNINWPDIPSSTQIAPHSGRYFNFRRT